MGKKVKSDRKIKSEPSQMATVMSENTEEDKPDVLNTDIGKEPDTAEAAPKPLSRKGRLIVRNLPYKITLEKLKKHFGKFGELTDATILKKPDGKLVGCGFVQFASREIAAKAVTELNGKPLLGRPVIVDWAIPKDQYVQAMSHGSIEKTEDKETPSDTDLKIKEEADDASMDINTESNEISSETGDGNSDIETENEDDDESDASGSDDDDGDDDGDESYEKNNKLNREKYPLKSDVSEGCTVFVKNLPFGVDNEALRETMKQFGHLYYAVVCIDPLTEHSKGTGFVKFKTVASAEACIAAGNENKISLEGRIVVVQRALSREDVNKPNKRDRDPKDNRNLYLAKEGLVVADSPAATGVSQSDMEKRLGLEEKKRRLLKNLHFFISPTRLTVYNIPLSYDDQQLRSLFLEHGGPKSVVTEALIMRNMRDVDAKGLGRSKGFGFVTFASHDNALQALRSVNNNPKIFSPGKRPIVMFSIENRAKLNIKRKRLDKSRRNLNGNSKGAMTQKQWENSRKLNANQQAMRNTSEKKSLPREEPNATSPAEQLPANNTQLSRKERRKIRKIKLQEKWNQRSLKMKGSKLPDKSHDEIRDSYQGVTATPGQTSVMSSRKLAEQSQIFQNKLKEKKKMNRRQKLLSSERIKQPKQKMKKPKDQQKEDKFSELFNHYKQQLNSTATDRKKWYENEKL